MSSWSGGQFRVQNELRMDRETIAKGGRRGGPGVRRLKGDGGGGGYRRKGEGVGGERASGMAWTGQHVDYLLLYRSGNNGIPIMKWISLGSQWTSMHASRDPTPPSPPYPIGLLQPTDVHRAGPPSLVHLSDQPHLLPRVTTWRVRLIFEKSQILDNFTLKIFIDFISEHLKNTYIEW